MRLTIIFFCIFSSSVFAEECAVSVSVKPDLGGGVEIFLENNSTEVYDFRYHDLPWVVTGQGGVGFKIYTDEKRIPVSIGMGNNNEVFKIWPKSKVSGIVDAAYLKMYYKGVEKNRVKIE